ncbi:MAG: hypothetical protein IPH97_08620 [Ignavibacteriales bacterium]|nr:hypothetical protein [Ignavibacteriales bacterium]
MVFHCIIIRQLIIKTRNLTETNNQGFEVQRLNDSKIEKLKDWENIGFVNGKGTTTEPQSYSIFMMKPNGKYQYRLNK